MRAPGSSPLTVALGALVCLCVAVAGPSGAQNLKPDKKFSHGLLWRVSKLGPAPNYVFGTIHVADPRVLDLPDAVTRALVRSRYYYTESLQGKPETMLFFEAAQFDDGRRLEPLIGSAAYAKVAAMLRGRQVPDHVIARLKPWAALANFVVTPEDYERTTLDQKLIELARTRQLRVLGLEGVEERVAVFERVPLDTQVNLLRHVLDHRDELAAMIEPIIRAWMNRDLAGIRAASVRVGERYPEVAAEYRILFKNVVDNRSIVMAHRLYMPLRGGAAFVAVGANHLYGGEGMLALIEKQGYRVERVY